MRFQGKRINTTFLHGQYIISIKEPTLSLTAATSVDLLSLLINTTFMTVYSTDMSTGVD